MQRRCAAIACTLTIILVLAARACAQPGNLHDQRIVYQYLVTTKGLGEGRNEFALDKQIQHVDAGAPPSTAEMERQQREAGEMDPNRPSAVIVVSDGQWANLQILFADALATPQFAVRAFAAVAAPTVISHGDMIVIDRTYYWSTPAEEKTIMVPVPPKFHQLSALFDQFYIEVEVLPRVTSTFVYAMQGLHEDLLSNDMYDLVPTNSSMLFKFLARVDNATDTLGVWVYRKPPIPDFTLQVFVDGRLEAQETVSDVPPPGLGLTEAVSEVSKKRNSQFLFKAIFYEKHRQHRAYAEIRDVTAITEKLSMVDLRSEIITTDVPNMRVKLQYYNDTKYVALKVLQPHPITLLQVSIYDHEGRVVFREEENHVPYFDDQEHDKQMGWYHAIPTLKAAEEREGTAAEKLKEKEHVVQLLHNISAIEVRYNERRLQHPVELMIQWIQEYGGRVTNVGLSQTDAAASATFGHNSKVLHDSLREKGLVAKAEIAEGTIACEVPYKLLLTNEIASSDEHARKIIERATEHQRYIMDRGYSQDAIHFALLTYFAIAQPASIEGVQWRLYFDTLPRTVPPLPVFYSEDERALFSFCKNFDTEIEKMIELWETEFNALKVGAAWIEGHVDEKLYFHMRSLVESRVVNASGVLLMIPLFDYLNHDDAPNSRLTYNDTDQFVQLEVMQRVPRGAQLTIDYGAKDRTKRNFLLQFGFIPPGAVDSVDVEYRGKMYTLTDEKASRQPLMNALYEGEETDDPDKIKAKFASILQSHVQEMPSSINRLAEHGGAWPADKSSRGHQVHPEKKHPKHREIVAKNAQRLLASERAVLDKHLKLIGEDGDMV